MEHGFDSRAIRFKNQLNNKKIFELDVPITQATKKERIKWLNEEMPLNLVFVSIDFNNESLEQKTR